MTILFILLVQLSWSQTPQKWWIGNVALDFVQAPEGGLVNPSCLKNATCLAALAVKNKASSAKVGRGGKNPGSDVCRTQHKGSVVIASRGDRTQGFCHFSDDSYVSLDGLFQ